MHGRELPKYKTMDEWLDEVITALSKFDSSDDVRVKDNLMIELKNLHNEKHKEIGVRQYSSVHCGPCRDKILKNLRLAIKDSKNIDSVVGVVNKPSYPKTFELFGSYLNEPILVLGHGESAEAALEFWRPLKPIIIGVNDHDLRFPDDPADFHIVVDPPMRFPGDRRKSIESATAPMFTQLKPSVWNTRSEQYQIGLLGRYSEDPTVFKMGLTSVFIATQIAFALGSKNVEVAGVDLVDHVLYNKRNDIKYLFLELNERANKNGNKLYMERNKIFGWNL